MTELELFNIIRPIVLLVTGVPECILTNPNANSPSGDYAAVAPKSNVTSRGQANIVSKNKAGPIDIDVTIKRQLIAQCSVQFYRGEALDYASRLIDCNKRSDVSRMLYQAGVGWNRTGTVNNLSGLQSDNQENRSQISLFLMYEEIDETSVNSIERIQIQVQNEDVQVLETIELETPDAP